MDRRLLTIVSGIVMVSIVLAACGAGTATPMPTSSAAGPTETPQPVTISVWHGYTETEAETFTTAVNDFMTANPDVTVDLLAVPFDQLQSKFQTEAATGGGSTLVTGPQDRMAAYNEAGLLATIPESEAFLNDLVPAAVDGGRIGGVLVGVPLNNKVVAMYYNKTMVDTLPSDFAQLLNMAATDGLAITADWFHNYMWVPAFGAQFLDANNKCVLDTSGAADAFAYFKQVCDSPGVTCDTNDGDMDILFRQGQAAFRFQGPWIAGDAIADLGEGNVGVTAIPPIPSETYPRPWNQSEMIQINVNATDAEKAAALRLIAYLVSADVQTMFLDQANWIPSNQSVDTSSNAVVGGFLDQVPYSDPFPVVTELNATWDPMQNAVTQILQGVASPQDALTEACQLINTANGK